MHEKIKPHGMAYSKKSIRTSKSEPHKILKQRNKTINVIDTKTSLSSTNPFLESNRNKRINDEAAITYDDLT